MAANIILSKDSNAEDIKRYFEAILKLSQSDDMFPVNLDEVWMLVYSEKGKAVRALKENFIEDFDYITYAQNGKTATGGFKEVVYKLSTSCLEYFIARKVRPVFEVYRQVFHKVVNESQIQLSDAEMILRMAQLNVENERRMKELENKLKEVEERTITDLKHSTLAAYVTRHNIPVDMKKVPSLGRKATNLCKKKGVKVGRINDVRWGSVGVYPDEILDEVFANYKTA